MTSSVYVAASEGFTGKSPIALGMLEQLSRVVESVGVFRPIMRAEGLAAGAEAERDYVLDLLTSHEAVQLSYEECAGVTYDDVYADPNAAMERIVERYHQVAERCDAVLIVGSDFTNVTAPTEFAYNARIASNLGAPVLLIVSGAGRTVADITTVTEVLAAELKANHATLFAVIANRVDDPAVLEALDEIAGVPAFGMPHEPLLNSPSVADLMAACDGQLLSGDEQLLGNEVSGLVVAAMTLPNVLDRLFEGATVITPGDRPEIVLGVLNAHVSTNFPQISGIVLNGGLTLPPQVGRLLQGLGATTPIITTELGTHATTTALSNRRGRLSKDSPRKIATALRLFVEYVDGPALVDRLEVSRSDVVTPLMFEHQLLDRAVADRRHIVLPEGEEDRILRAADILLRRGVADLTLLGDPHLISARAASIGADVARARLLSPHDEEHVEKFAAEYYERRKHKGVVPDQARDLVSDVSYFGTMMVELGLADGMVSGAVHTTAHTIRPSLEVVKTVPGVSVVSSVFFMCLEHQVLVFGDCAVNPDPNPDQLAEIAVSSARTAAAFGIEPRVAMLSYSTGSSGSGTDVEKVSVATAKAKQLAPDLAIEGPIQYDAAVDPAVAATKLPGSAVAGKATVLIFPDLNTGNNTYKAVQRSADAVAIGPVLQGLRKPVNDLSRGALVRDIVNTVAITAIQSQRPAVGAQAGAAEGSAW